MVSGQSFHGRVLKGLLYDTLRRRNEQTPSFKHQASGKLQAPRFTCERACGLWLVDSLVLGVWCLEFLAFFFMKPTALVSGQSEVRTKPREC